MFPTPKHEYPCYAYWTNPEIQCLARTPNQYVDLNRTTNQASAIKQFIDAFKLAS